MKREREQRGSAIIEAVLCLTIFITAIFTILSFIRLCRTQAIISNAVDATAREMSQYAYFYHISGLESLDNSLTKAGADSREKFNTIAGSTEAVYAALGNLGGDVEVTIDSAMSGDVSAAFDGIEDLAKKTSISNVDTQIDSLYDSLEAVTGSDPTKAGENTISFLKGMVAVAGSEASSMIKSQLIAAPLAKLLIQKHFQVDGMSADEYLKSLGISEGMEGLNFKMSTIFAPTSPNDINLVVYYQMDIVNFMNFDLGKVTLCKQASTRAWLGGDQKSKTKSSTTPVSSGVWEMGSFKYGSYITEEEIKECVATGCVETAVAGTDAFDPAGNTLISIRSMDFYASTYLEKSSNIVDSLMKKYYELRDASEDIGDVVTYKDSDGKNTMESLSDSRKIKLIVVVPEGTKPELFDAAITEFVAKTGDSSFTVEVKQKYGKSVNDPTYESTAAKEEKEE